MGKASNSSGYLKRTTNVPQNGTNWTQTLWVQLVSAPGAFAGLWDLSIAGVQSYIDIGVNGGTSDLVLEKDQAGAAYNSAAMLTLTLGARYFLAIKATTSTNVRAYWRAESATSLSTTGDFTVPNLTWDEIYLMSDGIQQLGPFQVRAAKLWHAALSDADILTESFQDAPIVTSGLDSFLPLAAGSASAGDDVSSNNRDWTVTGTFTDVDLPAESRRRRSRVVVFDDLQASDVLPHRLMPLASFGATAVLPIPAPRHPQPRDEALAAEPPQWHGRATIAVYSQPAAVNQGTWWRERVVRDDALDPEQPQHKTLSFAALSPAAAPVFPWVRRRRDGSGGVGGGDVPPVEPPLHRPLPYAAFYVPPTPVPNVRRRLDVRRNRARVR